MKHQNKAIIVIFFLPFSSASIVDFEQINISWDMSTNRRLVKDEGRRTHSKCCSSKEGQGMTLIRRWHLLFSGCISYNSVTVTHCLINDPKKRKRKSVTTAVPQDVHISSFILETVLSSNISFMKLGQLF